MKISYNLKMYKNKIQFIVNNIHYYHSEKKMYLEKKFEIKFMSIIFYIIYDIKKCSLFTRKLNWEINTLTDLKKIV